MGGELFSVHSTNHFSFFFASSSSVEIKQPTVRSSFFPIRPYFPLPVSLFLPPPADARTHAQALNGRMTTKIYPINYPVIPIRVGP
jgi:hypothetical protein